MSEPALTPEQWEHWRASGDIETTIQESRAVPSLSIMDVSEARHAVAATCLYGQPFGFAWADVTRLRLLCGAFEPEDGVNTWLPELADRIAALLPPRDVVPKEPE